MDERFIRTELLIGSEAMQKLRRSHIAVFGAGGVGGYVIEALVRSGVGTIDVIDKDTVSQSNINRQIIAADNTVGMSKTQAAAERAKLINPDVTINRYDIFYTPETADIFDFSVYDYIVDAVDTVSAKIELVVQADKHKAVHGVNARELCADEHRQHDHIGGGKQRPRKLGDDVGVPVLQLGGTRH